MINTASATVTTQGWWHFGEGGAITTDSSGNGHNYLNSYFSGGAPPIVDNATGGPLGVTGFTSTEAAHFGFDGATTELYGTGYNPPGTNYGIEIWFLPQNKGYVGGTDNETWLMSTGGSVFGLGPGGGAAVRIADNFDGTSSLHAGVVHSGDSHTAVVDFGPAVLVDTNHWIHLALVNMDGALVFYTNGVACATNDNTANPLTDPAGDMFIGTDGGFWGVDGYLDEERVFTFASGQFTTNDLLLRPLPSIVVQPQSATVWNNGAANFSVLAAVDPNNTYQWVRGTSNVVGALDSTLYLSPVTLTDSGSTFDCIVANNGRSATTSVETLTVVPNQAANNAAYRAAILGESSLIGYYEIDGSGGSTIANAVGGAPAGDLEGNASFDGGTNRSYGERALYLTGEGDVQIPAFASYEFPSGAGTVEALVDLFSGNAGNIIIFSEASPDGSQIRYAFAASGDGSTLSYTNDSGVQLSWPVPNNLLNRLADVAFTINNNSITAYLDGQSLGAKTQSGFGSASGAPLWIGSSTTNDPGVWTGTIDELALYSSALSDSDLQIHYATFVFGTNTSGPTVASQSSGATLYAGGTVVLGANIGGTPPFTYQWRSNNVPISGAKGPTLTLAQTQTGFSASYTLFVNNSFGSTNTQPIDLTFVAPPNGYASKVMADNPSAYWRLDESSGTTMNDYAGGLNGSYIPGAGSFTLGATGALVGDPDTAVAITGGAYAQVPYSSILNTAGPFTLELWLKPADTSLGTVFSSQFRGSTARLGIIMYQRNGGNGLTFEMGNSAGITVEVIGATAFEPNNWYHTAIVYDGASNVTAYVFGYVDGTSAVGNGSFVPNSSSPFEFGIRNGLALPYNGTLDDIAFYNYALSQAQLKAHVASGLPLTVSANASASVVADEKPDSPFYDGLASAVTWEPSDSDGTTTRSGVMQFVDTNVSQITDFGYPAFDFDQGTIMFWMRSSGTDTSDGANEGAIIFDRRSSSGTAIIQHDDGNLFFQSQNNYAHFESSATVSDNKWHHCAYVFDDSITGSATLYIDGVMDSSTANANAWSWPAGTKMEIGADTMYDGGYWRNYNGLLDDFRLYNRNLTPTEIGQAMSGAIVDASALQLQFNFSTAPNGLLVTAPYGSLLSATVVTGPYTSVTNASSPLPVAPHGVQMYFEGKQ
jgi:hypothetical protein